jgi:hypothetical protein
MSGFITLTASDILQQLKLSYKFSTVIETIIHRKLIANMAAEAGIIVETKELQDAANRFRSMYQLQSAGDTWAWLEKNRLSLEDFEKLIGVTVLNTKVANHLFADKIEPYFFERQLDYAGVVMYEVVLEDEDLAMELFYALREGEMSFPEVAHQYIGG